MGAKLLNMNKERTKIKFGYRMHEDINIKIKNN